MPAGFVGGGGYAYVADRATSNNPHPGTDNILRVGAAALGQAGVRDGDLLIAAEGGAVTIDVACAASCISRTIVSTETTAHIEGHLVVVANQSHVPASLPPASDLGSQRAQQLFGAAVGVISVAAIALLAVLTVRRLRRR